MGHSFSYNDFGNFVAFARVGLGGWNVRMQDFIPAFSESIVCGVVFLVYSAKESKNCQKTFNWAS